MSGFFAYHIDTFIWVLLLLILLTVIIWKYFQKNDDE